MGDGRDGRSISSTFYQLECLMLELGDADLLEHGSIGLNRFFRHLVSVHYRVGNFYCLMLYF